MKKLKNINQALYKIFLFVFSFTFSMIIISIIFNKSVYNYSSVAIISLIIFFTVIICLCYYVFLKKEAFFQRHFNKTLIIFTLIMFSIQLIAGYSLRFEPVFDLEAIYQGAKQWASTGTFGTYSSGTCNELYFYVFPNNLGGLTFLTLVFKLFSLLKIRDTFAAAMIVNGLMSVGTMVITSLICKKLLGVRFAITALLLFLLSPPFYFIAPVFYTDSLTMIFPAAAFYLFILSLEEKNKLKLALYYISISVIAAVGALIKFTVLIVIIAILIFLICKKNFRRFLALGTTAVFIISAMIMGFNGYIYSNHLDKEIAKQTNAPYSYWLAVGFNGNGTFSNECYEVYNSIDDPELRKTELNHFVVTKIRDLGVPGVFYLFNNKSVRAFGDGTYALSDFLDDNPQRTGKLHSFILYDGEHYKSYQTICSGIFIFILILLFFSGIKKRKGSNEIQLSLIPQLCVFGLMLFLIIWEVNSRYITNFIPMIFICAVYGIDNFYLVVKNIVLKCFSFIDRMIAKRKVKSGS